MDVYKTVNEILVDIFNEISEIERNDVAVDEFADITYNDMHIIDAIGPEDGRMMTEIARRLKITVGSLTTSMNSLVRKNYVVRERSEEDRRVVFIRLTSKGKQAYQRHADFHKKMIESAINSLREEEIPSLLKCLDGLCDFFKSYRE